MKSKFILSFFLGIFIMLIPFFIALFDKSFATVGWVFMFYSVPVGSLFIFLGPLFMNPIGKVLIIISALFLFSNLVASDVFGTQLWSNENALNACLITIWVTLIYILISLIRGKRLEITEKLYWLKRRRKQFGRRQFIVPEEIE